MKKLIILLTAFFSLVTVANAEIPNRPNPPKLVNDFANVLGKNEVSQLEGALVQFARETSTQIVVVTVADLEDYAPGDYAVRLAEKWGVGQKDKDNGLVILLKPKTGSSRGEVFIATGYGLEGVLPDAIVNGTIIDNEMIPRFKQNDDYFGGLASGIKVIMDLTKEEYTAEQYQESVASSGGSGIPFIIILFVLIFSVFGRGRRRRFYSPGRSLPFWLAMGMMSGGSRSSGSFGNFTSGGGSFGGGGFGGFGGGGFGGGGAGGSW